VPLRPAAIMRCVASACCLDPSKKLSLTGSAVGQPETSVTMPLADPTPGRIRVSATGTKYQDEREYGPECTARMHAGYVFSE
jgi:hypothetical protein